MTDDDRPEPPHAGDERSTLIGFLELQRATVIFKARGLSDADGAESLVPSATTITGLIRHLTDVERSWFRDVIDKQPDVPARWSDENPDGEFWVTADVSLEAELKEYELACAESRQVLERYRLDDLAQDGDRTFSVRFLLLHMIEETARHAGHIDILREQLDGFTGE